MKIVFLDRDTLSPQTTLRPPAFPHEIQLFGHTASEQVAERISDADAVMVNKVKLTREALAAAPRLRLVAVAATGTDNIDLAACRERGIVVSNIRNYASNTVPEHTFALHLRPATQPLRRSGVGEAGAAGKTRDSSATSTTRSGTWRRRRWASSEMACWARRSVRLGARSGCDQSFAA